MIYVLTTSERRSFKRCRKRWEYSYLEGLQPRVPDTKLFVGSAVHAGLAAQYRPGPINAVAAQVAADQHVQAAWERVPEQERETDVGRLFWENAELTRSILNEYLVWAERADDFEPVCSELRFEVPLFRGLRYAGALDGLVRDREGRVWIIDHKVVGQLDAQADYLELDDQATAYTWAVTNLLQGRGFVQQGDRLVRSRPDMWRTVQDRPQGMLFNYVRRAAPKEPSINKDGSVSLAAVSTTVERYRSAIERAHGSLEPWISTRYADVLARLAEKHWYLRVKTYRSDAELSSFVNWVRAEWREMNRAKRHPNRRYRTPTRDCRWDCPYFTVCLGEYQGLDMDVVKDEEYNRTDQPPIFPASTFKTASPNNGAAVGVSLLSAFPVITPTKEGADASEDIQGW